MIGAPRLVALLAGLAATGCGEAAAPGAGTQRTTTDAAAEDGLAAQGAVSPDLAPRVVLDLSGPGWRLRLDPQAEWEQDELFAPPVDVAALPVNPPTGGWAALSAGAARGTAAAPERSAEAPATGGGTAGTSGTAGAAATAAASSVWDVSVPGTVEEYAWNALAAERGGDPPGADTAGDYVGVSWWWREVDVPPGALAPVAGAPRHLELQFDAVRQRAEVFVNERLVGYDVVGNTPFRVDITAAVRPGRNVLAVRVTDPGGNFSWEDFDALRWGAHTLPASHGFGGVTGPVRLVSTAAVHLRDLWVANRRNPRAVEVVARIVNPTGRELAAALTVLTLDAETRVPIPVTVRTLGQPCPPGESDVSVSFTAPNAALWSPESPRLYTCRVALTAAPDAHLSVVTDANGTRTTADLGPPQDVLEQRFGFRWFEVSDATAPPDDDAADDREAPLAGSDGDAIFRLNGRRIMLRSAISWGFWPASGAVPTPELARAQALAARALGLNLLNHHRTLAAPGLLDVQDELGLLAYEEPGGYAAHGGDAFCRALAREKLLRMVRRDRSHPSLVIVNLINEETAAPTEAQRDDLAAARALDGTRVLTFTSGWAPDGSDPLKLHGVPGEGALREIGWSDYHNAPGPGVWRDEFWKSPEDFRRRTVNRGEIVFWGEEGAIAAPPRLQAIRTELLGGVEGGASGSARDTSGGGRDATSGTWAPRLGWDGADYLAWAAGYESWLAAHGFGAIFPSLDALTISLGDVAYDYQARMLQNVRLADVTDGYVINGWEDSKLENHSGIVDVFRNPKGTPERLAAASAPVQLVVKLRQSVVQAGEHLSATARGPAGVVADLGLINEAGLHGPHELRAALRDAAGSMLWEQRWPVDVSGGEIFGQLLATDVSVTADLQSGPHRLSAELRAAGADTVLARGSDELLVVDWKGSGLPPGGAYYEQGRALRRFFEGAGWDTPPLFHPALPKLAWVAVGDFDPEPRELVPASAFRHDELRHDDDLLWKESVPGLQATFTKPGTTWDGSQALTLPTLDAEWSRQEPVPGIGLTDYSVTYAGVLTPPAAGRYVLHVLSDDAVRVWLDGALVIDHWESHAPAVDSSAPLGFADLSGHALKVEYRQEQGEAVLKLFWTTPERLARTTLVLDDLLRRARVDGTRVLFLDHADRWAPLLAARDLLRCDGVLEHERYWLGGGFFSRAHPLLAGLPSDGALGRPFQELVKYDARRYGLRLAPANGQETVVGCVAGHEFEPASALAIVPCGEGRLLLNTLDLVRTLNGPPGPADTVRTLFRNMLDWAAAR